jgi:cytochrome c oxidase cbb3-type subunit 1
MSAISSPAQPVAGDNTGTGRPPVAVAEIDASCRAPVLLLFVSAALWLLAASVLGMVATLKFHSPELLADCPWMTYGRVHPANLNALVYGFAAQAGLGVLLWLLCHLGRTRLEFLPGIIAGVFIWNAGVTIGILGIIAGENTGYEWLEMPRYAMVTLFGAYLLMGLGAMMTFHRRRAEGLYISEWFLLAAVFWFPWIYSTAGFLLVAKPVRGALQAVIDAWYVTNLNRVWFGFIGLAAIFYFIPKLTKRPLHSHYLGVFIFWTLAMFGSWGGVPVGAPLPSWVPALSTVATVLVLVPVLGVAMNVRGTAAGECLTLARNSSARFIIFSVAAYVIAGLSGAIASLDRVSEVVNFTWFLPAQTQLNLYGFFAMAMFGSIYLIVPRLLGAEFSPRLVGAHFWLAALGIVIYVVPLAVGGAVQGGALNLGSDAFFGVMHSTLPFLRASTTGDLLMAAGHLVFLLNLAGLLARVGRQAMRDACACNLKTVEAAS